MWNECKGFIAIMLIFALAACLIIIGMFIGRPVIKNFLD